MNADPFDRSTFVDIFKYLPRLRELLSCSSCQGILKRPVSSPHDNFGTNICFTCRKDKGKEFEVFIEDKKLRILVLCYKRLCAYISDSRLGVQLESLRSEFKVNGCGSEIDKTVDLLKEADLYDDVEFEFTPTPQEIPSTSKKITEVSEVQDNHKLELAPENQIDVENVTSDEDKEKVSEVNISSHNSMTRRQGRPKGSFKFKSKAKRNRISQTHQHVEKLKKIARNSKGQFLKSKSNIKHSIKKIKSRSDKVRSNLPVPSRPHRHLSGKCSVGQLWRETFLEDAPISSQSDSGLGSSSDHDAAVNAENDQINNNTIKESQSSSKEKIVSKVTSQLYSDSSPSNEDSDSKAKPRLTMKITKRSLSSNGYVIKSNKGVPSLNSKANLVSDLPLQTKDNVELDQNELQEKSNSLKIQENKKCYCSRFKHPNQMTCKGKRCPCFSKQKCCFKCKCNGCRNPFNANNTAPPLSKVFRGNENLETSFDKSMPRLSPITSE